MKDDLSAIAAFSMGYEAMCEEISRQAFGMTTEAAPLSLTREALEAAWALVPRRPRLELELVSSTQELTEAELESTIWAVKRLVEGQLRFRGELEALKFKVGPIVFGEGKQGSAGEKPQVASLPGATA